MKNIEVYGKDNCPYCTKAKMLLDKHGLSYEYYKVGTDITKEELVEKAGVEIRTVPQIFIDGKHIGGYDRLSEYMKDSA